MKRALTLTGSMFGPVLLAVSLLAIAIVPVRVAAAPALFIVADAKSDACAGIGLSGTDCNGGGDVQTQASSIVGTLINLFSIVVGVAAVIMVMVAGARYITSSGDPGKVSGAKNTLLYALVGLLLVGAAQAVVHFVITNVHV